jgi:protocatechuate 3,4-dioxygenase beta subunit
MRSTSGTLDRRQFAATMGLGGVFYAVKGAFAQSLVVTPEQTIGPYYPDRLPLDLDNDLLIINDNITPAVGQISWISGRILDQTGQPVRGALVEIWQADNNGAYIHSASPIANRDSNFQGYGKFLTGSSGEYLFRTVKPGLYPGRTRHIHYAVTAPGRQRFTTQLYVQGESLNASDGVLNGITNAAQRSSVVLPWTSVAGSKIGELAVTFDIVLGYTWSDTPAAARPTMASMVNGASFQSGGAPASWVTIFGNNLSTTTRTWRNSEVVNGKLPQNLDGVQVQINGKAASVYYISPKQLNVQVPDDATSGNVQVLITNANGVSDPLTVPLQPLMPAFFLFPEDYVAAVRSDGAYIGPSGLIEGLPTTPAQPQDLVMLFGTGFGATNPNTPAGQKVQTAAPLAGAVTIQIDNSFAGVSYAGLTGAGLYQFIITVPDLPDGDHAVSAAVDGVRTQRIGRIRIQRQTAGSRRSLQISKKNQAAMALRVKNGALAALPPRG